MSPLTYKDTGQEIVYGFLLILIISPRYFTRPNYEFYYTLVTPLKGLSNYFKVLGRGCPAIQPGRVAAVSTCSELKARGRWDMSIVLVTEGGLLHSGNKLGE